MRQETGSRKRNALRFAALDAGARGRRYKMVHTLSRHRMCPVQAINFVLRCVSA
jgi:hypothetical protein